MASLTTARNLFVGNVCATLPFGVAAFLAPSFVFQQFGVTLDAASQVVTRGYAAAALAYGFIMLQLRDVPEAEPTLLRASAIFNVAEVLLQGHAATAKTAGFNDMIWVTLLQHLVLGVWSVWLLLAHNKKSTTTKAD